LFQSEEGDHGEAAAARRAESPLIGETPYDQIIREGDVTVFALCMERQNSNLKQATSCTEIRLTMRRYTHVMCKLVQVTTGFEEDNG
jgi:hypothetical protein